MSYMRVPMQESVGLVVPMPDKLNSQTLLQFQAFPDTYILEKNVHINYYCKGTLGYVPLVFLRFLIAITTIITVSDVTRTRRTDTPTGHTG